MNNRKLLGLQLNKFLKNNQRVGVGTGSTVKSAIPELASYIKQNKLNVSFVSTSLDSSRLLADYDLQVLDISAIDFLDWGFDGADAVDPKKAAIKGKGGAMLREKIMATLCKDYYLIVDQTKLCQDILAHAPVPIEIIPEALSRVEKILKNQDGVASLELRFSDKIYGPALTEKGNFILDVKFTKFNPEMEQQLKSIVGVVETGLFLNYATKVFVVAGETVQEI